MGVRPRRSCEGDHVSSWVDPHFIVLYEHDFEENTNTSTHDRSIPMMLFLSRGGQARPDTIRLDDSPRDHRRKTRPYQNNSPNNKASVTEIMTIIAVFRSLRDSSASSWYFTSCLILVSKNVMASFRSFFHF